MIKKTKCKSYKDRLLLILLGLVGILDGIVEVGSLGYLTTTIYKSVLLSTTLEEWVEQ